MKKISLTFMFLLGFIGSTLLAQHAHEVPEIVKKHFVEKHSKATDVQWEVDEISTATGHEDIFVVEYTEDDIDIIKVYDASKKLLETRTKIKPINLQSNVRDSLEVHYPGLTIYTINKIEKQKEQPYYQMMIKNREGNYFLQVSLKGIILLARKD
ncbi:MAG: hypothetical protein J5I47_00255 [Vicingus serpentipes]|nr:hypothetical protein [Vicingus serpentipes]